jgi:hypothetical protein
MNTRTYIGKCKTKGCKHATRVDYASVQQLDSTNRATYNRALPYDLNGLGVAARCPDHGVYKLSYLKGHLAPDHKCDARCTTATGPSCDCSCGGANHGAAYAA